MPPLCALPPQVTDTGRPTYEGLKHKLAEKDAQLDEALAIIKELSQAMQGKSGPATPPGVCPACGSGAAAAADAPPAPAAAPFSGVDAADADEVSAVGGPMSQPGTDVPRMPARRTTTPTETRLPSLLAHLCSGCVPLHVLCRVRAAGLTCVALQVTTETPVAAVASNLLGGLLKKK